MTLLLLFAWLQTGPTVEPGTFHNCPVIGDATGLRTQALNRLKNRATVPTVIDPTATLEAVDTYFHDDRARFKESTGAEWTGYVVHVASGAKETVNCHSGDPQYEDTHIEMSVSPTGARPHTVVTEVTARWRAAMKAQGVDWSTAALEKLKGKRVTIRGWLMLDLEHVSQSENTHSPGSPANWRQSAWELHPAVSITVVQ